MSEAPLPIHRDPEIMGGAAVFVGTRAPAQTLPDYLEGGVSIDTFVEHFPSVPREQAVTMLARSAPAVARGNAGSGVGGARSSLSRGWLTPFAAAASTEVL